MKRSRPYKDLALNRMDQPRFRGFALSSCVVCALPCLMGPRAISRPTAPLRLLLNRKRQHVTSLVARVFGMACKCARQEAAESADAPLGDAQGPDPDLLPPADRRLGRYRALAPGTRCRGQRSRRSRCPANPPDTRSGSHSLSLPQISGPVSIDALRLKLRPSRGVRDKFAQYEKTGHGGRLPSASEIRRVSSKLLEGCIGIFKARNQLVEPRKSVHFFHHPRQPADRQLAAVRDGALSLPRADCRGPCC